MFSTNFIFRQQENLVDNQKCQAGFRPLCNKIPFVLRCAMVEREEKKNPWSKTTYRVSGRKGLRFNLISQIEGWYLFSKTNAF